MRTKDTHEKNTTVTLGQTVKTKRHLSFDDKDAQEETWEIGAIIARKGNVTHIYLERVVDDRRELLRLELVS